MNESRAGSISVQLQETIRRIKRYPDALREISIKISNAEAHIGTVQQTATNRIEVIRTEMSRALHEHKERIDRLIADLTARVMQLEAGHAHKTASDHSTPSRPERAQFFDISDHDVDIPRPTDLPPATGSFFSGRQPSVIPRSSLLGPIDHGSMPGCNAAPAEKASTAQSQTSSQTLDEILRRAKLRASPEQAELSMPDRHEQMIAVIIRLSQPLHRSRGLIRHSHVRSRMTRELCLSAPGRPDGTMPCLGVLI